MNAWQRLKQTCTVQPRTGSVSPGSDGHNAWTWPSTYTNVRCLFYAFAQGRKNVGGEPGGAQAARQETVADFLIDLLPTQALAEDDRIVFDGITYFVISVKPEYDSSGKLSFKTAYLRKDVLVS